jgi:tetratricopeptide (TPR) repeat protein
MLSSTYKELREHREAVRQAMLGQRLLPIAMEDDSALPDQDLIEASLAKVDESDAYVGLIGYRYGQTPADSARNPEQLSLTELEFRRAVVRKIPICMFIMHDEHPVPRRAVGEERGAEDKYQAFVALAKRDRIYAEFKSVDDLKAKAVQSLVKLREVLERSAAPAKATEDRASRHALTNIPVNVPRQFIGRDEDLAAVDAALKSSNGRAAITALHGLRGVGKTTLAAAYAERHRKEYRATWWIRAETIPTMRADIVGLGVRLGWVVADEKEEPALASILQHLRDEGGGILLIYDNANNVDEIDPYIPHAGATHIIVTSNAPNWRSIATPVEIEVWPPKIGADYLIERTGRGGERDTALSLSEALDGLPLAHEQAAAYCERLGVTFATYHKRYNDAPVDMLDDPRDAPSAYHNRLTAAKTFALAIDEAAKLHPAAEPLIKFAALLEPEPIPLFLFSEAREEFDEPLASNLAGDGLDEAAAALRAFALLDREIISDERDPSIATDCIRLHRLVREVAAARHRPEEREQALRILIAVTAGLYSGAVWRDPHTWPRVRRLDAFTLALVGGDAVPPKGAEENAAELLIRAGHFRQAALAAYAQAKPLFDRSLAIREEFYGPEHPLTAQSLTNLGYLLRAQGDLAGARRCYERALAINEKALGPDHPETAKNLNNLGFLLQAEGDKAGARPYIERALAIKENSVGPNEPDTALSLNNLGGLLHAQGDLVEARPYYERALSIYEETLGPNHPDTALSLHNLGSLLRAQGEIAGARQYNERALAIREKVLGPNHPDTAMSFNNLGYLLGAEGDLAGARSYFERALAIFDNVLGTSHPTTKATAGNTVVVLDALKCHEESKTLRKKFGI